MSDIRYLGQYPHVLALKTLDVASGLPDGSLVVDSLSYTAGAFRDGPGGIIDVTTDSGSLSLRSWSLSADSWSVRIACNDDARRVILAALYRGRTVGLFVRFLDSGSSAEERVATGRVDVVSGAAPTITVKVTGIVASLRHARWDGSQFSGAQSGQLFGLLSETTVASSYSVSDTTLVVADSSGFQVCDSAALHQQDLVEVVPTSGDNFYLLWTSESAGTITLDPDCTSASADRNQYDTDRANAAIGQAVYERHLLWGKPWILARKVITSTGAGTNGFYDTLISDAGIGVPEELFASSSTLPSWAFSGWGLLSGTIDTTLGEYDIDVIVSDVIENPLSWMSGWLNSLGLVLTPQCGRIDVQPIWDPEKAPSGHVRAHITDDEIVSVDRWESYDDSTDVHYFVFDLINGVDELGATDANFNPDDTRFPMRRSKKLVNAGLWHRRADGYGYASEAGDTDAYSTYVSNEVVSRLGRYYWDSAESVVVTCINGGTKRIAGLVPGQIVEFTTSRVTPRPRFGDPSTYDQRRALVTRNQVSWPGDSGQPVCQVSLAILPENYDDPV